MNLQKSMTWKPGAGHFHRRLTGLVLAALTAMIFGGISAHAIQPGYSLNNRDKPFGVTFIDEKHGWVVGDSGLILETRDGGVTWVKHEGITGVPLFAVHFVDMKEGWIVGKKGLVLHTDTGGECWTEQKSETDNDLFTINFFNAKKGFAVGAFGTILQTTDGGVTWQVNSIDWEKELKDVAERMGLASPHLYDLSIKGRSVWIVGENGVILQSNDGGTKWDLIHGGNLPFLLSHFRFPDACGRVCVP